jgi:hypothetical protein
MAAAIGVIVAVAVLIILSGLKLCEHFLPPSLNT